MADNLRIPGNPCDRSRCTDPYARTGTHHTHDGQFRFVFGEPEQMADLLRSCLPPALVAAMRWSTLRRLPDTLIDKVLGARRGDLFFAVEVGSAVLLLHVTVDGDGRGARQAGRPAGGMHALLVGLLESRFGDLSPDAMEWLTAADAATLQRWSLRSFAARSLADVFAE